jgi:tripartite-type tricarboxylate transporter receptor subunit TctC
MIRTAVIAAALSVLAACMATAAQAEYPDRNITIVVPYPPGSTADLLARELGQQMTMDWGQQVLVENRPGAGGSVGADFVAHAKPDGYTLLLCTNSPLTTNLALYKSLKYETLRDFAPIALLGGNGLLVVTTPSQKLKTFQDLIELAKKKPDSISVGTSGNGTTAHLALAQINKSAGVVMTHVPYNGGTPSLTAVMSGEVQVTISDTTAALPSIRDGRLIALASTASHRPQVAPEIPTMEESGYPGLVIEAWAGLLAPNGTPDDIIQKLNIEANRILAMPAVRDQLVKLGVDPAGSTSQEFLDVIKRDIPVWRDRVKAAGLAID